MINSDMKKDTNASRSRTASSHWTNMLRFDRCMLTHRTLTQNILKDKVESFAIESLNVYHVGPCKPMLFTLESSSAIISALSKH